MSSLAGQRRAQALLLALPPAVTFFVLRVRALSGKSSDVLIEGTSWQVALIPVLALVIYGSLLGRFMVRGDGP